MSSRLWSITLALMLLGSGAAAVAQAPDPQTADRVYRYRTAEGRELFTNAGRISVAGQPLVALELPALSTVDFTRATPAQLQQLDRGVQRAHEQLQAGGRCDAIRASLRVPTSTFLWREHVRELGVFAALLATALLVMTGWHGRLRRLMPIPPLLGCIYLGYSTYARVEARMGALREGLRACSSELPAPAVADPRAVEDRLRSAASLQATIERAYGQRAELSERMLRER